MNQTEAERICRERFERGLSGIAERMMDVPQFRITPGNSFSKPAAESYEIYIAGHFYGAVAAAQAYVERLGKFIAARRGIRVHKEPKVMWPRLAKAGVIAQSSCDSALAVREGRHDFHHFNKGLEQDPRKLRDRARGAILALRAIEDDVFGSTFADGALVPKHPEYWDLTEPGKVLIELRNLV